MNLATFLLGIAGPLAMRIVSSLGIGILTFTGVTEGLQSLIGLATSSWGGMAPDVLALAAIMGAPQGLGIIAGAMTSRVGLWVAVSATRFVVSP